MLARLAARVPGAARVGWSVLAKDIDRVSAAMSKVGDAYVREQTDGWFDCGSRSRTSRRARLATCLRCEKCSVAPTDHAIGDPYFMLAGRAAR
jgi:hypothetical protein